MRPVATTPRARRFLSLAGVTLIAAALLTAPAASAACPDAEVVFARGREEPPGVGAVGDAFVNSLRAKTPKSVGVYGVNYPANITTGGGASDIRDHVQFMAQSCPNTRIVIGGYSLGAEVVDRALVGGLPRDADQHVAAVVLFGNGTRGFTPAFAGRTIDQCAAGDPICGRGTNWPSHLQPSYIGSGLVDQAASFAAGRL
ncbi:cutinase family protein [Mycobacterium palustre]|uniref:Cutinase n=1 Tax=Mycobacterium palustre TaxID=153971 RepID=A0A1X1ZZC1_9MYCO|nr:cutinase family protein [Mycobacterium palustre]MCV7099242.1 cutinase family protein [Mycobacterium palustre]ORW32361.1 cutinase [Mycobacterium palustre]